MKKCPKCHKDLTNNASVCLFCGTQISLKEIFEKEQIPFNFPLLILFIVFMGLIGWLFIPKILLFSYNKLHVDIFINIIINSYKISLIDVLAKLACVLATLGAIITYLKIKLNKVTYRQIELAKLYVSFIKNLSIIILMALLMYGVWFFYTVFEWNELIPKVNI